MQKITRNFAVFFLLFAATSLPQTGTGTHIYTVPDGLAFNVDGQRYTNSTMSLWPGGTKHILDALISQIGGLNSKSRYAFKSWNFVGGTLPGGATVTVTADPALKEFWAVYS